MHLYYTVETAAQRYFLSASLSRTELEAFEIYVKISLGGGTTKAFCPLSAKILKQEFKVWERHIPLPGI